MSILTLSTPICSVPTLSTSDFANSHYVNFPLHQCNYLDLVAVELVRIELTFSFVGTPSVTHVTYNEQSRTLTCISTGGPATNVTWRRDGVVITLNATHQQTKKLVDSVNGTYQTVLTIDPSDGQIVGTYTCTVENVRGGSSETVVVPGKTRTMYPNI